MTGAAGAALVTGATRRIGRTLALRLAGLGFDVAVHGRGLDADAAATVAAIEATGRRGVALAADLAVEAQVTPLVPAAAAALGPLTVLVNSAAIFEHDRLATMTRDTWDRHMAINLRAPAVLTQAFVAQLPAAAEGLVVNLIDERILNLTPNYLSYSVSKMGLWAMTQVLARELAPRVRVNAIGPGPALPAPGWSDAEFAALCRRMPLRRGTDPEEIAAALAFILRARSMTGHMIVLDGGQHLGWLTPGGPEGE
jgi:NAD(P)-dependent dehydrogenase (short-subunit alcohol dehydrogenase family)